ncbi:hypothetical protein AALO_G00029940 [Alosa alosa]|uniref:Uncharacterized protein n=1 Tax=Alosa alosa TaxID=278164 RepID=A0AAV6HE08_9TELE|nr:hypothetical protein AALO_G00029940 [Alosa alosa]
MGRNCGQTCLMYKIGLFSIGAPRETRGEGKTWTAEIPLVNQEIATAEGRKCRLHSKVADT